MEGFTKKQTQITKKRIVKSNKSYMTYNRNKTFWLSVSPSEPGGTRL